MGMICKLDVQCVINKLKDMGCHFNEGELENSLDKRVNEFILYVTFIIPNNTTYGFTISEGYFEITDADRKLLKRKDPSGNILNNITECDISKKALKIN